MLSFFCRARSASKQSSLQDIGPNVSTDRPVSSSHSAEEKDLCVNQPAGRTDNQSEFVWLKSHQVNRANRANRADRADRVNKANSSRMGKVEHAHRGE